MQCTFFTCREGATDGFLVGGKLAACGDAVGEEVGSMVGLFVGMAVGAYVDKENEGV